MDILLQSGIWILAAIFLFLYVKRRRARRTSF